MEFDNDDVRQPQESLMLVVARNRLIAPGMGGIMPITEPQNRFVSPFLLLREMYVETVLWLSFHTISLLTIYVSKKDALDVGPSYLPFPLK